MVIAFVESDLSDTNLANKVLPKQVYQITDYRSTFSRTSYQRKRQLGYLVDWASHNWCSCVFRWLVRNTSRPGKEPTFRRPE